MPVNHVLVPIDASMTTVLLTSDWHIEPWYDTHKTELVARYKHPSLSNIWHCFEKNGVLLDANNDDSVISKINLSDFKKLKDENIIFAGMIPKLENAFAALEKGVEKVIIGKAESILDLVIAKTGTTIQKS